jgi:hypothetical protein
MDEKLRKAIALQFFHFLPGFKKIEISAKMDES